jgi:hypothetical protein
MKIKELNIHNFKNIKFSINNFGNYSLFFIFALLIPFQEWPDVNQHYQLKNFEFSSFLGHGLNGYVTLLKSTYIKLFDQILIFLEIDQPLFIKKRVLFFADAYFFYNFDNDYIINLIKLIFIIPIFFLVNKVSKFSLNKNICFAPPYIFSLMQSSIEPFSILLITTCYIFMISDRFFLGLLIGFIATILDRSMVPSLLSIFFFLGIMQLLNFKKTNLAFLIIIISIIAAGISIFYINDLILKFYNLSYADKVYLSQFGKLNLTALISSLSGLYGWMTLRPFPWLIYYALIITCFIFGVIKLEKIQKIQLFSFVAFTLFTMFNYPPLSQARFFPLLTLIYWETILIGAKSLFGRIDYFISTVILMTFFGLSFIAV